MIHCLINHIPLSVTGALPDFFPIPSCLSTVSFLEEQLLLDSSRFENIFQHKLHYLGLSEALSPNLQEMNDATHP
jgi:hypothetical protein